MADYSVKAILSATDRGFSSTLKSCSNALDRIDNKISGFSFGILAGAGQAAFNLITNSVTDLISEVDSSNAAWKTFTGNMEMLGKSKKDIAKVKNELQDFAQKTVYSSSDMAQTFAQLEAVGVKNTTALVKGFGGLAAAAENPQQAMKTLSTQATQMAAKPTVAWADFKLMLEQTPAGIAAVAKHMGMSTAEMVTAVQDGEIATDDFLAAIAEVGTNKDFSKLATEAKTMGQAMDGLKETAANKLMPAFEILSQKGITAINGIADKLASIDAEEIATKVSGWIEDAQPYWESFKTVLQDVGAVIKTVATFLAENKDTIAKVLPYVIKAALAYKGFKIVSTVLPFVKGFTNSLMSLAGKGIAGLAGKLFGISKGTQQVGTASATSGTQMLTAAKSFALMGVGVLAIAAGFALLAQSAIALSNAGGLAIGVFAGLVIGVAALGVGMAVLLKTLAPMGAQMMPVATAMLAMGAAVLLVSAGFAVLALTSIQLANAGGAAIAVMVGMVATVALLAVGAAALAPALTAGAVGLIAFGAAVVLVATGALLAAAALAVVSAVLPAIVTHGAAGAVAIAQLGVAMVTFAVGAATAGAALIVLTAGLVAFAAGLVVATAGMAVFAAGMLVGAAGVVVMAGALVLVNSQMKDIAKNAKNAQSSLTSMQKSVKVVESGLNALSSKATTALNTLKSKFSEAATKAKIEGTNVGKNFTQGMQSQLNLAPAVAMMSVTTVNAAFMAGYGGAYSAGAYISSGFAKGMESQLSRIRSAADAMVRAAEKAIRAKAMIHSPSRLTDKLGQYFGEGFVNGVGDMVRDAKQVAQELITIPTVRTPALAGAYGGELSSDYSYGRNAEYVIEVPFSIDGREFAKATASYTEEELNKKQSRDYRKQGKL